MVSGPEPILVKRYAGVRLYDTVGLRYVSPSDLLRWQASGIAFVVIDALTGAKVSLW
jgi:polyhydroxyalkanoate synthesis regulator protein